MIGRIASIAWTITALFFVASAVIAPVIVVIQKARARGKRLFVDEPMRRLGPRPVNQPTVDHRWDGWT